MREVGPGTVVEANEAVRSQLDVRHGLGSPSLRRVVSRQSSVVSRQSSGQAGSAQLSSGVSQSTRWMSLDGEDEKK